MEVQGINGAIELTKNKIIIKRKGFLALMTQGFKGDKEIYINQISSVQLKKTNLLLNGYIQFTFSGGKEAKGGITQATKDENTVMFNKSQEKGFINLKNKIEEYIHDLNKPIEKVENDPFEQIEKLLALKERGIITDEEFEIKKKQILGL